jgi:hypothetical protein
MTVRTNETKRFRVWRGAFDITVEASTPSSAAERGAVTRWIGGPRDLPPPTVWWASESFHADGEPFIVEAKTFVCRDPNGLEVSAVEFKAHSLSTLEVPPNAVERIAELEASLAERRRQVDVLAEELRKWQTGDIQLATSLLGMETGPATPSSAEASRAAHHALRVLLHAQAGEDLLRRRCELFVRLQRCVEEKTWVCVDPQLVLRHPNLRKEGV